MVCNLVDIDAVVRKYVVEEFDHEDLNQKTEFQDLVPTTENLAVVVFNILKPLLKFAHLEKVRIEETSNNSFEYAGGADPVR
jgi:6-pyruvoyltetrahydropterin/6-carboxytetrahydropterin synthase